MLRGAFFLGIFAVTFAVPASLDSTLHNFTDTGENLDLTLLFPNGDGADLPDNSSDEEERAREFLKSYESASSKECNRAAKVEWQFATDITKQNEERKLSSALVSAEFEKQAWLNATSFDWKNFKDPQTKRQFLQLSVLGTPALSKEKLVKYNEITTEMESIYSSAKVCDFKTTKCGLALEPEISEIMAKSRDYAELEHFWTQWHDMSGGKMRDLYPQFVELSNEAARLNNFSDTAQMWMLPYESDTFREDIEGLWQTLKPLYDELHAYVRHKLSQLYGADKVKPDEPIPAHLLGNMWAQQWNHLLPETVPHKGLPSVDVTDELNNQGFTPLKMFQVSEDFFVSLGLKRMTPDFWKKSLIEKPQDGRDLICHASAWDFCDGNDVRIKQCTRISMDQLITVHHEMGHIQYYLQYKDQPKVFRTGANPGFHEAVGDTLALSVATPEHLAKIGLLKNYTDNAEADLNALFTAALEKITFLPFAYLMDKWRWDVFEGKIKPEEYNCHWWKLREEYQGVKAPSVRNADHFDPGAKYHIAANVEYLRYFVSYILQFQFHRALCIEAGQYDVKDPLRMPLHKCDIHQSKEAGKKLSAMLSLGASRPWPEILELGTGTRKMDAGAFREFFAPLEKWLKGENKKNNVEVGWKKAGGNCISMRSSAEPEPPTKKKLSERITDKVKELKDQLKGKSESSLLLPSLWAVMFALAQLF